MSTRAIVIVPTHDHASTLPFALRSALAQTVEDLEVHVIGDGIGADTREVVDAFARDDARVRFHDKPKGPRLGEMYRHALLGSRDVQIVTYLSDDDLLLPEHVETMENLLADADFAHPPPMMVDGQGKLTYLPVDLAHPRYRALLLAGKNRVPLTGAAHTGEAYRRLPFGWRTTPVGMATDLYMWQQFLAQPWCRAVSGTRVTAYVFPSPLRTHWTPDQRAAELARWVATTADASEQSAIARAAAAYQAAALGRDLEVMRMTATRWWRVRAIAATRVTRVPGVGRLRRLPPATR